MKNIKKIAVFLLLIITLASITLIYPDAVRAAGGSGVDQFSTYGARKGGISGSLGLYYGGGSTPSVVTTNGTGGQCTGSCFSGRALFFYLIKYDSAQKKETIVGKPLLVHTKSFLADYINVKSPATDAKAAKDQSFIDALVDLSQNSGIFSGMFSFIAEQIVGITGSKLSVETGCTKNVDIPYEFEELISYSKDNIKYIVNGTTFAKKDLNFQEVTINLKTDDANIKKTENFIRAKIKNLVGNGVKSLKTNFGVDISESELDKYYIAVEFAERKGDASSGSAGKAQNTDSKVVTIKDTEILYNWECVVNGEVIEGKTATQAKAPSNSTCYTTITHYDGYKATSCMNDPSKVGKVYSTLEQCQSGGCLCNQTQEKSYETKYGEWKQTSCATGKVIVTKKLYTKLYKGGKSTVQTARSAKNNTLISEIATPYDPNSCKAKGSNCIAFEYTDKTGKKFTEYFIGPDLQHALVGYPSSTGDEGRNKYKYTFWTPQDNSNKKPIDYVKEKYALGVSYWWVMGNIGNGCEDVCGKNASLACAENYCQNLYGREARTDIYDYKKECIVNSCNVPEPSNACGDTTYNSDYLTLKSQTQCSSDDSPKKSKCGETNYTAGLSYDAKGQVNTNSNPTLWCYTDPDGTLVEQRSFINVSCAESQQVTFSNPAKQKITAGIGVYYNANLKGQKVCNIWFDMKRWEFEYASFGLKEKYCTKDQLVNGKCPEESKSARSYLVDILNAYNLMQTGKDYDKVLGQTIASMVTQQDADRSGISWQDTRYTITKADGTSRNAVSATISEKLNNEVFKTGNYSMNEGNNAEVDTAITTLSKATEGYKNNKLESTKVTAKVYRTESGVNLKYEFEQYCFSTDGRGTITKSEDGNCYTINDKKGKKTTVAAQRVYYTSLKAMNKLSKYALSFDNTNATITSPVTPPVDSNYSRICEKDVFVDSCTITTKDDPDPPPILSVDGCEIVITANGNTTIVDGIYKGTDGVTATLTFNKNLLNNEVVGYNILKDKKKSELTENDVNLKSTSSVKITPKSSYDDLDRNVAGIIKLKSGEIYKCSKKIKMTNIPDPNKCTFTVTKSGDSYKIVMTNYTKTPSIIVSTLGQRINSATFTLQRVSKTDRIQIIGYDGKNSCGEYVFDPGTYTTVYNCKTKYPDGVVTDAEIKNYCSKNWQKDENNFESSAECINSCKPCPVIDACDQNGLNTVKKFCGNKYTSGSVEEAQCINKCYSRQYCDSGDYVYRPISNSDPFPRSYESIYIKGTRQVGANWVGFEKYITNDDDDTSSVTGANANTTVEYVIDLSPSTIKKIREDSSNLIEEQKLNGYTDYVYYKKKNDNPATQQYVTAYKSSFIHEKFRKYFSSNTKKDGTGLQAVGDIKQ